MSIVTATDHAIKAADICQTLVGKLENSDLQHDIVTELLELANQLHTHLDTLVGDLEGVFLDDDETVAITRFPAAPGADRQGSAGKVRERETGYQVGGEQQPTQRTMLLPRAPFPRTPTRS